MIIQERKALFGGRTTDIDTEKFICVVTTAKESLMEGLSTIIWSHSVNGECAKLLYNDFLSKATRQRLHHNICQIIDSSGEKGIDLGCAIDKAIKELEKKDFLKTSVNLLENEINYDNDKEHGPKKNCRVLAEQGDASAQFNLGLMYADGEGVLQNDKEAVKWFRKAAEQGIAQAQSILGVAYGKGQGVLQDDKEAVKWYRKAAEQGIAQAQSNLGGMYFFGRGVPKDYVMAHMYCSIAVVSGDKDAIKNRDRVEGMMTPSQLAEAQKLAREWMSKH